NYYLLGGVRVPASYDYYMLVNGTRLENQYAVSLAGGTFPVPTQSPVLYSFANATIPPDALSYKTSNTHMQPFIRKKATLDNEIQSEVLIYPNPTNDFVNIDFNSIEIESAITVRIIGIDGKLVYE